MTPVDLAELLERVGGELVLVAPRSPRGRNPWTDGPSWLHLHLVSANRFDVYERYFTLSDLRVGRLLNLSIALPAAYVVLTRYRARVRPFERLLVVLGQRSLGAFVLHVYGLLLLAHMPLPDSIV